MGDVVWLRDWSVDREKGVEAARDYLDTRLDRVRAEARRHRALAIGAALCGFLAIIDAVLLWVVIR